MPSFYVLVTARLGVWKNATKVMLAKGTVSSHWGLEDHVNFRLCKFRCIRTICVCLANSEQQRQHVHPPGLGIWALQDSPTRVRNLVGGTMLSSRGVLA